MQREALARGSLVRLPARERRMNATTIRRRRPARAPGLPRPVGERVRDRRDLDGGAHRSLPLVRALQRRLRQLWREACPSRQSSPSSDWAKCWSSNREDFDLSVAGGVSLAVVISTHVPARQQRPSPAPAVLMALSCALAAGVANGVLVGLLKLNAIVATIGVNALIYGGVFAVSGGMPRTTTPLLAAIAGGERLGRRRTPSISHFRSLLVVSFVLKKTVVGRRFEAIGANPSAARAVGLHVRASPDDGLCLRPDCSIASPASCSPGITRQPTAFQGDSPAASFRRRRGSRRDVADRRPRLPDLHRDRRVLPQSTEPIRARCRRALFGPDHHSSARAWIWYRRLFNSVDRQNQESDNLIERGGNT